MGPEILAFVSLCSANFQSILDCFIPNFKSKYKDSENIKADCVDTAVFNLHQIKHRAFCCSFFGTPGRYLSLVHNWSRYEVLSQKLRFEYLQKRAKNRVSISDQITEVCLHGNVIYMRIKLSLFCVLFKDQDRP